MRQIRCNVFETNSSSSHAITFCGKEHNFDYTQLVPDNNRVIHCWFEEFGWGYYGEEETNSAQIKLNYLITQIVETNDCPRYWCCENYTVQDAANAVMNTNDFKVLEKDIISTLKKNGIKVEKIIVDSIQDGYIDHLSVYGIKELFSLNLIDKDCKTFSDFIFDKSYNLDIKSDCDNLDIDFGF